MSVKNFRTFIAVIIALLGFPLSHLAAQADSAGFVFTTATQLDATPIKNQSKTGTCWSFATSSFLESELMRMGKGEHDLSEMFVVRNIYPQKALNYVQRHGSAQLGAGSLSGDMMRIAAEYGVVPEAVYNGKQAGYSDHNHQEMDAVLNSMLDAIVANKGKQLSNVWKNAVAAVLDVYLGEIPETFEYRGKSYTPKSFAAELGFKTADYIELTSFSHHPFYSKFAVEIPDNWANNLYFNVPLDELMEAMDNALENGYTVGWDGDVSEKTFNNKKGIAILPLTDWSDMTEKEQKSLFDAPSPEKDVTQALRQEYFENYATTDDHLMHITGITKDQNGTKYYITKNSWGTKDRGHEGYVYMSESYVRAKTISIMMHHDALPKSIGKKLAMR